MSGQTAAEAPPAPWLCAILPPPAASRPEAAAHPRVALHPPPLLTRPPTSSRVDNFEGSNIRRNFPAVTQVNVKLQPCVLLQTLFHACGAARNQEVRITDCTTDPQGLVAGAQGMEAVPVSPGAGLVCLRHAARHRWCSNLRPLQHPCARRCLSHPLEGQVPRPV